MGSRRWWSAGRAVSMDRRRIRPRSSRPLRALLGTNIPVPVILQDERLSSHEAESRLATRESDWRKRKAKLDAMAAAIILQDYLDGRPRESNNAMD